ncbi:MAG: tetratricopeptide repeat protein [Chloroflexia bacterium]
MTGAPPGDNSRVATNAPLQPLQINLLGGFRVVVGSCEIPSAAWRLRKAAHLLKLLALAPGQSLHREQLLDALWPDLEPAAAARNLRYALHVARGVLEAAPASLPRALHVEGDRIVLRPAGPLLVDVAAFLSAAAAARRAPTPAAYEAALARYPDDLLPEDRYEDWAAGPRENLRETHLALLGALAGLHEASGALLPAIAVLERLTEREPLDDEAQVRLMRLLALTGQRGRALRQYARLRDALHRDLDAAPGPEALQLYAAILARRFSDPAADSPNSAPLAAPVQHNLPAALTSFVGRSREIAEVSALLAQSAASVPTSDFRLPTFHRLVTLAGAGGCGKTRLALEVARGAAAGMAYPDGVWLVDFAVVADPALLPGALARALGVREEPGRPLPDTLADRLRARATLLVFDNCEHVIDACAALAQALLEGCLRLRILATSREALHVPGELLWRVPPLTLPPTPAAAGAPDSVPLLASEAATLFFERARLVRPDFAIDADSAEAVVAICQRLEGLPLALELAAARLAHLSVAQLAARLDNTLQLLTVGGRASAPRQQTLRAALDWSHDLLSAGERALLRRLAAFAGGWTLSAAEAVGASDEVPTVAVLELLASLVDKSLVVADDEGGEARYRFLEPIRQYAAERLADSGELTIARERHAAHYLAFAEEAEPHLRGPAQVAWLGRLERDHDNLRAALRWAIGRGEVALEARLCAALFRFWYVRSHLVEGDAWLTAALARPGIDEVPALVRAKMLQGAGTLAWSLGQQARSRQLMEAALATFRQVGDQPGIAATLHNLGVLAEREGDYERAQDLYGESLPLRTALGDSEGAASTLMQLGNVARQQGDRRRAAECYEECLALQRRAGVTHGAAMALGSLGTSPTICASTSARRRVSPRRWRCSARLATRRTPPAPSITWG